MKYEKLVEVYEELEQTTKRLAKTHHISELLKKTPVDELDKVTLLLQGKVFPGGDNSKLGLATRMVLKAISVSSGHSPEEIEKVWSETGDLGETASRTISKKTQKTLFSQELNIAKVFENFRKISLLEGQGAYDKKIKLVSELLTSANPLEAKYIVRMVLEELRVGAGEGTLRDAIVWAFFPKVVGIFFKCQCGAWNANTEKCMMCGKRLSNKFNEEKERFKEENVLEVSDISQLKDLYLYDFILPKDEHLAREIYNYFLELVQGAYDIVNDFGQVAKITKQKGRGGLLDVSLEALRPIKVMLFQKVDNVEDGFEKVGKPAAIEFKYDGFRMQIHKEGERIKLFTRRLEEVTSQFPDIVEVLKKNVDADKVILDAEIIGFDPKDGSWLPFQKVSQRIKRKYDIHRLIKEVPVMVNVFDMMMIDDDNILKTPFRERLRLLKENITPVEKKLRLADQIITEDPKEAEEFYRKSLSMGNEGIMMKNLDAPYKPGSRVGYGVKVKPVMETLDLVITSAEKGEGKRSKWLSSFTLSCRDEEGSLKEIGKVGTGIKELEGQGLTFEQLTNLLTPLITSEKGREVKVKPEVVVEVSYEEIQKSTNYASGFALRFPRVLRLREDRGVDEISDVELINSLYDHQRGRNTIS